MEVNVSNLAKRERLIQVDGMSEGSERVRSFVSIACDEAVIEALQSFQRRLEQEVPRDVVRWTPPEQMHLTLKFLGSVAGDQIGALEAVLRPVAHRYHALALRAEGLGCFPTPRNPRVIWVGLQGDVEELERLQEEIEQVTQPWAEKDEKRKFHPHLTLGRVREGGNGRRVGQALEGIEAPPFGSWHANQFCLMRSRLSPKGATHSVQAEFALKKE